MPKLNAQVTLLPVMRFGLLCVVILSNLTGCSTDPVPQGGSSATSETHTIEFAERELNINQKTLPFPLYVSQLAEVLGPPDREVMLENNVTTWDELGIMVYEKKRGEPVISFAVAFREMDFDFCPSTPYEGVVRFGGVDLKADSTSSDLNEAGLSQDQLLDFLYVADQGEYQIIAELDDGLVEISIGLIEK